jgi:hypothetical protein
MKLVGERRISYRTQDGKLEEAAYSLWPTPAAFIADHPHCCSIYTGPSADHFTPLDSIPELKDQQGRVVRVIGPAVDIEKDEVRLISRTYYMVFDDCGDYVKDD